MKIATSKEMLMVIYEPADLWMKNCIVHGVLVLERRHEDHLVSQDNILG
jgi:hypothetical protein